MSLTNLTIVTAGAGAGKTYRLTQDIIRALRDEKHPPSGLLATSFTKKAAGEISLRVQGALAAEGMGDLPLHEALIGTVNSVCGRLLTEFAFEAGLSPDLTVLEPGAAEQALAVVLSGEAAALEEKARDAAQRLGLSGEAGWSGDWQKAAESILAQARANRLDGLALEVSRQRALAGLLALLGTPTQTEAALDDALLRAIDRLLKAAKSWDREVETKGTKDALETIQKFRNDFAPDQKHFPAWAEWIRLTKLAPSKKRTDDFAAVVEAAAAHHAHPRLHQDIETIIDAAYTAAAKTLDRYAAYKHEAGLIDFTDQETLLLDLLERNDAIADELAARLKILFVDEFQDTSPLQLALFLRLGALAQKSVWVGDPKQAIFGFRGTDPALMEAVLAQMGGVPKPENILSTSRRSRPALVELANEYFVPVFAEQGMQKALVALSAHRKDSKSAAPALQGWRLTGGKADERHAALATQVAILLRDQKRPQIEDPHSGVTRPVRGGDIAILCRDNNAVAALVEALGAQGVEVAARRGGLLDRPEIRLAMACLRRLADARDTLAAAEIAHLTGQDWLGAVLSTGAISNPRVAALDEPAPSLPPLAALDEALARAEILPIIMQWPQPRQRLANIEALRVEAATYEAQCQSLRQAATPGGFAAWLAALDEPPGQPEATSDQAVQILTYHRAKGLEWPLVIMAQLDKQFETRAFGVAVESDVTTPDPLNPLAGRWVRYWPWPYGRQSTGMELATNAAATDIFKTAEARQYREEVRLGYVGVTRARDILVLAMPAKTPWLDRFAPGLADKPVCIEVAARDPVLPPPATTATRLAWPSGPPPVFAPLRISPSAALGEVLADVAITQLGPRLANIGSAAREEVGEALHRFLAADDAALPRTTREALAARLLGVWNSGLTPEDCLIAADRFWAHINNSYTDAEIIREWPVQLRLPSGEELHGRLDALVRHAGGIAIYDHKSFPGSDTAARALSYLPQLLDYRAALQAQGFTVTNLAVHFPLLGQVALLQA